MAEALRPLAARLPSTVREHDILAIAGALERSGTYPSPTLVDARTSILNWAARKASVRLRPDWLAGGDIEHLSGGRNLITHSLRLPESEFWALRVEDPDKAVAGRVWTTEIVLGAEKGYAPKIGIRLSVVTTDNLSDISPAVPNFLRDLPGSLRCGPYVADQYAWHLRDMDDAKTLSDMLADRDRRLPIIVISQLEESSSLTIDSLVLGRALQALAHIVIIPAKLTYILTDRFGKRLSCFHGAIRVYFPGFGADADPYAHRLFLADRLALPGMLSAAEGWLRTACARFSIARLRERRNEASFALVRRESLADRARTLAKGADLTAQLEAERTRIDALQRELEDAKELERLAVEENHALTERAEEAERQSRNAMHRLQAMLAGRVPAASEPEPLPTSWPDFVAWVEGRLTGQVVLSPRARRQVSNSPAFQEVETAARCLLWLAETYRPARMEGGHPDLPDAVIMEGVRNARCGADSFDIWIGAKKYNVEWHIKNSNTRDPVRNMRIYYTWDDETCQVVIAEMPAHRDTDAT